MNEIAVGGGDSYMLPELISDAEALSTYAMWKQGQIAALDTDDEAAIRAACVQAVNELNFLCTTTYQEEEVELMGPMELQQTDTRTGKIEDVQVISSGWIKGESTGFSYGITANHEGDGHKTKPVATIYHEVYVGFSASSLSGIYKRLDHVAFGAVSVTTLRTKREREQAQADGLKTELDCRAYIDDIDQLLFTEAEAVDLQKLADLFMLIGIDTQENHYRDAYLQYVNFTLDMIGKKIRLIAPWIYLPAHGTVRTAHGDISGLCLGLVLADGYNVDSEKNLAAKCDHEELYVVFDGGITKGSVLVPAKGIELYIEE